MLLTHKPTGTSVSLQRRAGHVGVALSPPIQVALSISEQLRGQSGSKWELADYTSEATSPWPAASSTDVTLDWNAPEEDDLPPPRWDVFAHAEKDDEEDRLPNVKVVNHSEVTRL